MFVDIEPLALSVIDGYNVSIIAYGQTGSGKTYTMNGSGADHGVSYRTLQKMFQLIEHKKFQSKYGAQRMESLSTPTMVADAAEESGNLPSPSVSVESSAAELSFSIIVSMMEIYNEQVKDLLIAHLITPAANLDIRLSPEGEVFVPGLSKHRVENIEQVFALFDRGSANRATAATNLNEHSSRSHSILLVEVTSSAFNGPPLIGKLYLIDLAGSEKVGKSGVTGINETIRILTSYEFKEPLSLRPPLDVRCGYEGGS